MLELKGFLGWLPGSHWRPETLVGSRTFSYGSKTLIPLLLPKGIGCVLCCFAFMLRRAKGGKERERERETERERERDTDNVEGVVQYICCSKHAVLNRETHVAREAACVSGAQNQLRRGEPVTTKCIRPTASTCPEHMTRTEQNTSKATTRNAAFGKVQVPK